MKVEIFIIFAQGLVVLSLYWFRLACSLILLFGNGVHDDMKGADKSLAL
jgi:hypothetical protein